MKINKILAAGIAATLAVTSLSAVVSADTKSFDIFQSRTTYPYTTTLTYKAEVNKYIAQNLRQAETSTIYLKDLQANLINTLTGDGFYDYLVTVKKYSAADATSIVNTIMNVMYTDWAGGIYGGWQITATGYQSANSNSTVTKTFKFNDDGTIVVLDDKTPIYHDGEFASYYFHEITSLELSTTGYGSWGIFTEELLNDYWNWIDPDGSKNYSTGWRPLEVEDIAVYQGVCALQNGTVINKATKTAATLLYTYGLNNTSNATDLNKIYSVQAQKLLDIYKAEQEADTDLLGAIAGTPVTEDNIGKALTSTQNVYGQVAGVTVASYTEPGASDDDDIVVGGEDGTTVTATTPVTNAAPIVWGTEIKTSGYLYALGDDGGDGFYWSASSVAPTGNLKASSVMTAAATGEEGLALYDFIDKDEYVMVAGDAATGDAIDGGIVARQKFGNEYRYSFVPTASAQAFTATRLSDTISTAHLLAYAFANGGWYESKQDYGDNVFLTKLPKVTTTVDKDFGWLPKTTKNSSATKQNSIQRYDVWELSSTSDYNSSGMGGINYKNIYMYGNTIDANQTYNNNATYGTDGLVRNPDGTKPSGFAGLASQVADFFNKEEKGTITFTFTAAAASSSGVWQSGVPSTEVGLKGTGAKLTDFALFFNYNNTTGTMLSAETIDLNAGTITFRIDDYLDEAGGLTKATLENIYYGLDNGIKYNKDTDVYGLWVSKIELASGADVVDEDADVDSETVVDDTATDVEDDENETPVEDDEEEDDTFEDDEEEDDTFEEEDDETDVPADDEEEDDVPADDEEEDDVPADDEEEITPEPVEDDEEYVEPTPVEDTTTEPTPADDGNNGAVIVTPTADDDDTNPGTGVALAAIPALAAAAAAVIFKKRK